MEIMSNLSLCEYLDWDSRFFGCRIGRLDSRAISGPGDLAAAAEWGTRESIDCVYLLVDSDRHDVIRAAEEQGCRLVDVRVTLQFALSNAPDPRALPLGGRVRPARQEDSSALAAIARYSHRDSRFFADPCFPDARCEDLYDEWIRASVRGYADAVMVAEFGGVPVGYITLHRNSSSGEGSIGLVAVAEEHRGRKLGAALLSAALSWFQSAGAPLVTVVTQGSNVSAQRLYQRSGFLTHSVAFWYHWWLGSQTPRDCGATLTR